MLPPSLLARLNQRKKSCVNSFACNHKACQVNQIVSDRGAVVRRIACYASAAATKSWSDLVGLGRFELPTSPLSGVRSNQLSYRPAKQVWLVISFASTDSNEDKCVSTY